jgi:hypothetical protein
MKKNIDPVPELPLMDYSQLMSDAGQRSALFRACLNSLNTGTSAIAECGGFTPQQYSAGASDTNYIPPSISQQYFSGLQAKGQEIIKNDPDYFTKREPGPGNDPSFTPSPDFFQGANKDSSKMVGDTIKSSYTGSDQWIEGYATQYGCIRGKVDEYLIKKYKYVSAYGYKVRYGTDVGDPITACNFNYCGVAVSLLDIQRIYGSKAAGKDQPLKIVNKANLKCVIAPIQDISAVNSTTHAGSNARMDLSECIMQKLGGFGKITVMFTPAKKGDTCITDHGPKK